MGTVHVITDTGGDITFRPSTLNFFQCLVGNGLGGLFHLVTVEPSLTFLCHANEINGEFKSIATTLTQNGEVATLEIIASHRPAILPHQRTDGKRRTTTELKVCLPVERHHFDTLIDDIASEVSGTTSSLFSCNHHLAATVQHVTAYVVKIRTFDALGTAYHNIIGRVDAVAAGAVGTEQVIPAVAIHQIRSLTIDGNIFFLVTFDTEPCLGIKLNQTDGAEIGAIAHPQTTCRGIEQQPRINGILILHTVRVAHLHGLAPLEIGRFGIEGLVPHRENTACMAATEAPARGTIDAEITVADLQHIGGCTATRTVSAAMPGPTIFGYKATAASTEGVILAVALGQRRGIVDIRFAYLCLSGCSKGQCRQNCMQSFHIIEL